MARGEPAIPPGDGWLSPQEATRAAGMRFTKRRTEYRLRRYAGKCAVAATLGLPEDPATLAGIAVLNRITGAPYVEVHGRSLGLDVSLTDRAGWAICLVGADLGAVGVDLEIVEPRSPGFVQDFLTPAEQDLVATAGRAGQADAAANLVWSAKEAALKVMRTGLRADTRTVDVQLDPRALVPGAGRPDWQRLEVGSPRGPLPGWWRREGLFVLTVVTGPGADARPPQAIDGSADLGSARPIETWRAHPLAD